MSFRILLIEDEPGLVLTLTDLLASAGYETEAATDGRTGLDRALRESFDLIILDVMLPGKSGFDVCRDIRRAGRATPVIMLTARTQVADRVSGLKLGADDYLAKPFDPDELLARIEALLRRVNKTAAQTVTQFAFGSVQVHFDRAEVTKNGEVLALAGKELQLLRYLVENRGRVLSRDELLTNVWEYQASVSSRTIDVHMAWLRQKLEDNPQLPRYFHTVRGVGYRFTP